jgi:HAD superfamily hydrolase (TIGR01509 family)
MRKGDVHTIPSVVVFDLGKVLVDFDYHIAARKIAARSRIGPEEVKDLIDHSPLLFRYETGRINKDQFFAEVCAATGFCGELEEFSRYFSDIFAPIEPMVELHAQLRRRGVPTFIFSNTNELAVDHIRRSFPFFGNFDGYVLSYQHGAMKPEQRIYEVVEQMTKSSGRQILYLDDRLENAEAGIIRGWQVIRHETPEKSKAILEELNLVGEEKAP